MSCRTQGGISMCLSIRPYIPPQASQAWNSYRITWETDKMLTFHYFTFHLWKIDEIWKKYEIPSFPSMENWWNLKKISNFHWITRQIDEKLKKNANLNIMENCPKASNMSSQDVWKSPLCPTGHRPFGAAALLLLHFFSVKIAFPHLMPPLNDYLVSWG